MELGFPTLPALLQHVKKNGFSPRTVIDVGANVGNWSRMAHSVFPTAQYIMIDADGDNERRLKAACADIGTKSEYSIALLGAQDKSATTFYKMGLGSSVLPELTSFPRSQTTLPMETLDGLLESRQLEQPMLLKLDVQGLELEVLRGGAGRLAAPSWSSLKFPCFHTTKALPYSPKSWRLWRNKASWRLISAGRLAGRATRLCTRQTWRLYGKRAFCERRGGFGCMSLERDRAPRHSWNGSRRYC
ncbi:MAG TPA: FkbM family methyltransferase [Bryobacteraceae bacterium]|nr:FkbM family methyltransferase [Bryobacteraceae bacterium]